MIYLFLGPDLKAKDAAILKIKSKALSQIDAVNFDYEALDGASLGVDVLKKALITLPVIADARLVVVRNIHKLKSADITVLISFLKKPLDHINLVLESLELTFKGELKEVIALCQVQVFGVAPQSNVFELTKLMSSGQGKDALMMLNVFYAQGMHPLQIMGVLVWYWGKEGRQLAKVKFERGLEALESTDLNIKRSRLDPEYAVEKLVVELMTLRGRI